MSASAKRLGAEASAARTIAYEEDFIDARLVYRALPIAAPEREPLRHRLLQYLLGPLAQVSPAELRTRGNDLSVTDDLDRVLASFRDALDLYAPEELWQNKGVAVAPEDRALLVPAAKLVVTLYSARGSEVEVATGLVVLTTLEPANRDWSNQLAALFPWLDTGSQLSLTGAGPRGAPTTTDVLESVASVWPAPAIVDRLADNYLGRQDRLTSLLHRPIGAPAPQGSAVGELLLEGDTVQNTAMSVAGLYLRTGQIDRAAEAMKRVAGKPGDDPELRQLVAAVAAKGAKRTDYLALARRFLPRLDLLGGTSNDRVDLVASLEVLLHEIDRFPDDAEGRILAARIAFITQDTYLSVRLLEEAQPLLEKAGAGRDEQAALASELLERSFAKLRQRMIDSEHLEPATREADDLHRLFAESRRRFGDDRLETRDSDIDFEMARGLLNAGMVDRAEALLVRASHAGEPKAEVALELAKLATKRGDPRRAAEILQAALEQRPGSGNGQETIGFVETQSQLAYALGNAREVSGNQDDARKAWRVSLAGWERLMVEHIRRKSSGPAAEATMEVGRLSYLLGHPQDGIAKFVEAIEQNEARDQSYIDAMSFLVQRGDYDAALDIYRRALSKPSRVVSEYVKVYASLWILDLGRRSGRGAEPSAEAFLRTLANRRVHLRPQRVVAWYEQLARYTLGQVSYQQLLPQADTAGKRAEIYFYEAMHRLADGHSDDAHALWNKVLETQMLEFLEFDMASRYLRTGAPNHVTTAADSETI